jgi:Bacteriophage translational regulator
MDNDVFKGVGVEIVLAEKNDFLKIRETLTRIGVAAKNQNVLYQSCHILHKQNHYAIVHFKELFELDGKPSNISENDIARRNTIANLMAEWGLCKLVDAPKSAEPVAPLSQIKILPHKEKNDWQLVAKYNIGSKKKREDILPAQ